MSLQTELAKLEKELDRKQSEIKLKYEILSCLPEVGFDWRVFVYHLYDRAATVSLEYDHFAYPKDKPQVNIDTLIKVAEALPPLPVYKHKDSCVSFITREYGETKKRGENIPVAPIHFKIEVNSRGDHSFEFEWYTRLSNGKIVEVNITLGDVRKVLGGISYEKYGNGTIQTFAYHPPYFLQILGSRTIMWWSTPEEVNDITVYFKNEEVTPLQVAKAIKEAG